MTDPEESPREAARVTGGPWFVVVNDLVGGWSISTSPFPLSQGRGVPIADFMRRDDAKFIVEMRNTFASNMTPEVIRSAPKEQIVIADDGTLSLKPETPD